MSALYNLKMGNADSSDIIRVVETISAPGAVSIPVRGEKTVYITRTSAGAYTLAAPTSGTHDGVRITFMSTTAFAHTVTATTVGTNDGGTASDAATFGAAKGNNFTVEANAGDWWVVGTSVGVTFA
jgi:hypothetical protein